MEYVKTVALGRIVFLPIQKTTKLYYETRHYPSLGIVGTTTNDIRLGIKRWRRDMTEIKKLNTSELDQINVMD